MDKTDTTPLTYIYGLVDPREPDEVRYVGWTTRPRIRLRRHIASGRNRGKTYVERWIRKLLAADVRPQMVILQEGQLDYLVLERQWIAFYRKQEHRLTNMTEGGEGALGRVFSPASCAKVSEALKGRPKSPEHVAHFIAAMQGRKQSPEHAAQSRENGRRALVELNKSRIGIPLPEAQRNKIGDSLRGVPLPPRTAKHRENLSKALRGKPRAKSEPYQCPRCGKVFPPRYKGLHALLCIPESEGE